jgi:glycosyltransferase involved in cell wall biosynthesis
MTSESLSQFAHADLRNVRLVITDPPAQERKARNLWNRYLAERSEHARWSRPYDLFIAFAHGTPPYCAASNGALMVLFPVCSADVTGGPLLSIWRKWKWRSTMNSYPIKGANSGFTRHWTKERWGVDCQVVFPPVDIDIQHGEKANLILSVGRYAVSGHRKMQMEMLQLFSQLKASAPADWNYCCVGGCGTSEDELAFLNRATEFGSRCGAEVIANVDRAELKNRYRKSKIFWHAAGMDVDEHLHPELTEHFGMTTVEAMAAGCVPVVINKGGQPEIVEHGVSGFLWNTTEEWRDYTLRLMKDPALFQEMSCAARVRARLFSREAYITRFLSLLAPCFDEK